MNRELTDRAEQSSSASSSYETLFDDAGKRPQVEAIEQQMAAPDFWSNQEKAQAVVAELKALKAVSGRWTTPSRRTTIWRP